MKVEPANDQSTPKQVKNSLGWTVPSVLKLLKVRSNSSTLIHAFTLVVFYKLYAAITRQKCHRVELVTSIVLFFVYGR